MTTPCRGRAGIFTAEMMRIYTAADVVEAHLVQHSLAQAGIGAHVFNQNAIGAVGELPFTHAWPEVWLDQDADRERARAVVRAYESERAAAGQVTCGCGESSPENFALCWNCGAALDPPDQI